MSKREGGGSCYNFVKYEIYCRGGGVGVSRYPPLKSLPLSPQPYPYPPFVPKPEFQDQNGKVPK